MTDEDQTLIEYTYTYTQCIHIFISIFSLIFINSLLFWSFYTWLILVIYSLTNKIVKK